MKKILFAVAVVFLSNLLYAQKIEVDYDIDVEDVIEMFEAIGVENLKFKFPEELQEKRFRFIVKEYLKGELISSDTGNYLDDFNKSSTYILQAIMFKETDTTENVKFIFPPMYYNLGPYKLKYDRKRYGWASLIDSKTDLKDTLEIPFLTYTYEPTPKQDPNYRIFCALPQVSYDYKDRYKLFSVKHSYIFILKFD